MLDIFFFNVGDGDCELLRIRQPQKTDINILIDTGRYSVYPDGIFNEKSKRALASEHLKELGVDHIDLMYITHFHVDHVGYALEIANQFPVKKAIVPYIPSGHFAAFPGIAENDPHAEKWPEFSNILAKWDKTVTYLKNSGCELKTAFDEPSTSIGGLEIKTIFPESKMTEQFGYYEWLCKNSENNNFLAKTLDESWYGFSKLKNPDSLMELVSYAGRMLLFCGDRYASTFEDMNIGPCDLVKLPHHGDPQAMTPKLLEKLDPRYAIVSCQMDPGKNKDRPSNEILEMLQKHGTKVFCTENRELPAKKEFVCRRIAASISDDGKMTVRTE